MKKKKAESFDPSFYRLVSEVTAALQRNKDGTIQKEQVEELMEAEILFKKTILGYKQSTEIYKKFLQKVCIQNKNILSARPYFRETAPIFSKKITPAIRNSDIETLKTFNINYQLIRFIRDHWLGPFPKKAEQLYDRVHKARTRLIEDNMPLAINRAKLFFNKTPKSHITLIDMIGICSMGLAAGVDKWCGPYSPVFRSVCIGRMVGNLIDSYSETLLHFYPTERRILYKANSIRGRRGIDNPEELAEAVNESFKQDEKEGKSVPTTTLRSSELYNLMSAASTVSADNTFDSDGFDVYSYTPSELVDPEDNLIKNQEIKKVLTLINKLPIIHRKVLRLKGAV